MEHWFDSATKVLARRGASRREALKGLALTPIASLIPRQARAQVTPSGPGRPTPPSPAGAPCSQTNVGGKRTTTVSASATYNAQVLTLMSTWTVFGYRNLSGTFYQRAELGGKLLYELKYDFRPALEPSTTGGTPTVATVLGRLQATYASPITGPRNIITKFDGKGAFQG